MTDQPQAALRQLVSDLWDFVDIVNGCPACCEGNVRDCWRHSERHAELEKRVKEAMGEQP